MSEKNREPRNKIERLQVAAIVAPTLRGQSERAQGRRVALVDEDGNITGYMTLAEVQRQILERAKIEISTQDGQRPKKIPCNDCGAILRVPDRGKIPKRCARCWGKRTNERQKTHPPNRSKEPCIVASCGRLVRRNSRGSGMCVSCRSRERMNRNMSKLIAAHRAKISRDDARRIASMGGRASAIARRKRKAQTS